MPAAWTNPRFAPSPSRPIVPADGRTTDRFVSSAPSRRRCSVHVCSTRRRNGPSHDRGLRTATVGRNVAVESPRVGRSSSHDTTGGSSRYRPSGTAGFRVVTRGVRPVTAVPDRRTRSDSVGFERAGYPRRVRSPSTDRCNRVARDRSHESAGRRSGEPCDGGRSLRSGHRLEPASSTVAWFRGGRFGRRYSRDPRPCPHPGDGLVSPPVSTERRADRARRSSLPTDSTGDACYR